MGNPRGFFERRWRLKIDNLTVLKKNEGKLIINRYRLLKSINEQTSLQGTLILHITLCSTKNLRKY